ncbi:hypothetical protein PIB30_046249 [Stylosanthes scabra]|uniref:DUF4408 domain-containing protein n=1 Tax=Stylosanthes scabra TaxID=79078 RepID=A0ABU6VJA5_9FABA|nr:hypothetical protein [Stylosanthes scabra]
MAEPAASVTLLIASWLTPSSLFIFVNLVIGTIAITSRFANSPKERDDELQHHHQSPQLVRSPSLLQRFRSFKLTHQYTHDDPPVLDEPDCTQPQLVRTPSFLERVRSFGLAHYYNYDPTLSTSEHAEFTQPQLVRTPSLLERVRSFNFSLHKNYETTETSLHAEEETDHDQAQSNQPEVPHLSRTPSLLQRLQSINLSRLYKGEEEEQEPETSGSDPGRKDSEMRKSASERGLNEKNSAWEEDEEAVERRRPATTRESGGEDSEVDAKADDFINRFKKQLRLQRVDSILRYRQMLTAN